MKTKVAQLKTQLETVIPEKFRHQALWLAQDAEALSFQLSRKQRDAQRIAKLTANLTRVAEMNRLKLEIVPDNFMLPVRFYTAQRGWIGGL